METFTYKTADRCAVHLDLHEPMVAEPSPVVMWIHGGALISGRRRIDASGRLLLFRMLREAGFAQVSIDYRLAPETKLPDIVDDVRDAVRRVRTEAPPRLNLDATRLGILGQSAGGYLALMAGHVIQPPPQALVTFYGYGDITGDWYRKPNDFYRRRQHVSREEAWACVGEHPVADCPPGQRAPFYLYCRQQGRWLQEVVGLDPEGDLSAFDPFRPVLHVSPDNPPTLLLHGTADTDVPYEQSALMAGSSSARVSRTN